MVCRKSYGDAGVALLAIVMTVVSMGLTGTGIVRYIFKIEDDKAINRDHLILSGTLLSIVSLLFTLFVLFSGDIGPAGPILLAAMLFLLVLIIYLSNYDPTDPGSQWTVLVAVILDAIVKVTAILLGYGVCSVDEIPKVLMGMGRTVMGRR
jgi:amino acid transporter